MHNASYVLETEDEGEFVTVSEEDLETALGGRAGVVSRRWRFEWRDLDYTLLGGGPITSAILQGGSLKAAADAEIPVTGEITVVPQAMPFDITTGVNHLAITLLVAIGGVFLRMPQALMRVVAADEEVREDATSQATIKLVDLSSYLLGKTSEPYVIPAGSNVIGELREICDALNLQHDFTDSTDITPAIISVGPQTQWRVIADRLTAVSNLYPIAPDQRGVFRTTRRIMPKGSSDQLYSPVEPVLMYPPLVRKPDREGRYYNRAVSLFDHPDRTAGYVELVNDDPASNISIPARAEVVTQKLVNGGYVLNGARAIEYATWALRHQHALANRAELDVAFDPRQQLYQQVLLDIPGAEEATTWELLGWTVPLTTRGRMALSLGRAEEIGMRTVVTYRG